MTFVKLSLTAVVATLALGAFVSISSAARLSSTSQTFRATWVSRDYSGGFGTVRCPLTLEGSFHSRSIVKTAGSLIGLITRAIHAPASGCATGTASVLAATLPWHVQYASFTGTLPNITNVNTTIVGFSVEVCEPTFGICCLLRSSAAQPITFRFARDAGGALTSATIGGTIDCSGGFAVTAGGTSNSLTVLGSASRITVTLI
jgi:hypothetical protein